MKIDFLIYHSPDFYSFTLIEKNKLNEQSSLLEKDATLVHSFQIDIAPTENQFDKAKVIFNQFIKNFNHQETTS